MTVQDGMLVASGPSLTADLTEVDYTVAAAAPAATPGALPPPPPPPLSGTLYVPPGGTAALVADENATIDAGIDMTTATGKPGPHGGVVQVVGGDPLEIAATKDGTVRVYVLSPELARPVAVGDRKITLGVVAERPETVALVPDASLHFFVGHWHVHGDPLGITVHMNVGGRAHVAIVGHRPGAAVVVGVGAPVVRVAVADRWDDVDLRWWPRASVGVNVGVGVDVGVGVFGVEEHEHDHRGWDHDHGGRGLRSDVGQSRGLDARGVASREV